MQEHNPNDSKEPMIFVVGNSRSGTTLMGLVLGLNSQVFTFEELHFFEQLWLPQDRHRNLTPAEAEMLAAKLLAIQASDYISQGNPKEFAETATAIIQEMPEDQRTSTDVFKAFLLYVAHQKGKEIPCDQTPRNVLYIPEILELYPDARIINMIRDPRDVLLSQKYKWKIRFLGATNIPYREAVRSWINYHPFTISKLWNASVQAADKFADHPRVRTIRFEDLITKPDTILQEVCEFVGLDYDPEMLNVPQNEGGVSSHKKQTPGAKGIDNKAAGKWKRGGLSSAEIHICQQITQPNMLKHGYENSDVKLNPIAVASSWAFLPAKLSLALLFNLHRTRNIIEAIKRRL
jgi:hypothetical protein